MPEQRHAGREVLPIPDRRHEGLVTYDAKDPDTSFPAIEPLRPPAGAPNVLVVLLDDVGFGASSAFGGPCSTPTAERLAAGGLKYNRFHTTALCSPTRQALLTGRNHHAVGMGGITEIATSAPGYSSVRPNTAAPLAETLKLNGYATAQFGKCHEVPVWETSPMGPFDAWPTGGGGFEHFYGFVGAETNQWAPALYRDTVPVEPDRTAEEGYHFTEDLTDKAIEWVSQQKALMPDKPFFIYFAPGAAHAPHHVPAEWPEKYKGAFDDGWDAQRERTFARQKELGVIPADAELTARPEEIPAWEEMPEELKPVLARQMEVYAGFLEHVDHHLGRLVDSLAELEILDDTLIYYVIGDNGASGEGTVNGTFNELLTLNGAGALETTEFMASRIDKFGTPEAYNHYAVGWAHAMDTPYQWTKQVASHWGGTRNGTIVHWPARHPRRGRGPLPVPPRDRHRRDRARRRRAARAASASTASRRCRCTASAWPTRSTTPARPSAARPSTSRSSATAASTTRAGPRSPTTARRGSTAERPAFDDDVWELYAPEDWTQAHDLSAEQPDKLHELQRLFILEAGKYNVFPLDDRVYERFNADIAGRPQLIRGNSQLLFGGMGRLTENSILVLKNKSHAVTAQLDVPETGADGVIIAQGGSFGGWSLYAKDGRPTYCYNLLGLQRFKIEGDRAIPPGEHQVRMEFAYDGGGLGKGGTATLYIDGDARRRGPRRRHPGDDLLRRRDHRPRQRRRHAGQRRLRARRQPVHRPRPLGPDRHRRRRRGQRPPHQPRGAAPDRDGAPVDGEIRRPGR